MVNFLKIVFLMHLIKLNATPSTNDYLKQLSATKPLENFTVVWSDVQTKGKGQMGSTWVTEAAKNLTFSLYLNGSSLELKDLFSLNIMVANAVVKSLYSLNLTNIYVKWPNDILSYNKKIGGILIENNISASGTFTSIIGIGLNVNQTNFDNFPQASSLAKQYKKKFDLEIVLNTIVQHIQQSVENFKACEAAEWDFYHEKLFRKDVVSSFENTKGLRFNGIIKKVNRHGQLEILLDCGDIKSFNLKELKLLY